MARLRFQVWLDIREMQAEDLAKRVGVSNQAVQRWLKHGIPRARVKDVATALHIEPSELYRFVDTDIASELIDYAQDVKDKKRGLLRRTKLDTTAANGSAGVPAAAATTPAPTSASRPAASDPAPPPTYGALLHSDNNAIFADRRQLVDRRRRQSLSPGTPSRRKTLDRRDTRYGNNQSENWWLKVDYLDGQFDEARAIAASYADEPQPSQAMSLEEATNELRAQLTGTDAD